MAKTITETKEFLVLTNDPASVVTATYEVEDLTGQDAFEAEIKVTSIVDADGDPVHEENFEWMADSVKEQVLFHQFSKCSKNSDNECGHDKYLSLLNNTA